MSHQWRVMSTIGVVGWDAPEARLSHALSAGDGAAQPRIDSCRSLLSLSIAPENQSQSARRSSLLLASRRRESRTFERSNLEYAFRSSAATR
jgi:hypothetical protein